MLSYLYVMCGKLVVCQLGVCGENFPLMFVLTCAAALCVMGRSSNLGACSVRGY